jgi:hypothetical protein
VEKTTYQGAELSVLLTKYSGDKIEKNVMGGACSTYGREERCIQSLEGEPDGGVHLEDPGIDGRIILRWIFRKWDEGGMDCNSDRKPTVSWMKDEYM